MPAPAESINRLKTQQYETRKNDEFRAMGTRSSVTKRRSVQIEDQELELMDQADKLKVEICRGGKEGRGRTRIGCAAVGRSGGKGENARSAA